MIEFLVPLLIFMIVGAIVALWAKDLLSAIISFGIVGFGLVLVFLLLQAPDLAMVQIVVETLTLIIMVAAILKTSKGEISESWDIKKVSALIGGLIFSAVFIFFLVEALRVLPGFGTPIMRVAEHYIFQGLSETGASNLVGAVILDFRAYDTLGEATVLFTAVVGVVAVLRRIGRKK